MLELRGAIWQYARSNYKCNWKSFIALTTWRFVDVTKYILGVTKWGKFEQKYLNSRHVSMVDRFLFCASLSLYVASEYVVCTSKIPFSIFMYLALFLPIFWIKLFLGICQTLVNSFQIIFICIYFYKEGSTGVTFFICHIYNDFFRQITGLKNHENSLCF